MTAGQRLFTCARGHTGPCDWPAFGCIRYAPDNRAPLPHERCGADLRPARAA